MLIECKDCLRSISEHAGRCPHCGCPVHPASSPPNGEQTPDHTPPKSKAAAAILSIICCGVGIHRYYLGHFREGTIYLIFTFISIVTGELGIGFVIAIVLGIASLVDFFRIISGDLKDSKGNVLR